MPVNWVAELDAALADALDDRSVDDHVATLERLSVAAPDGHATTTCSGASQRANLPFAVDLIEGQVVVTATASQAIARGDVIVSVGGRPATEQLAADGARVSGSPQWRLVRARQQFGAGPTGSMVALRLRRGGTDLDVTVPRGEPMPQQFARPSIDRLDDGIYYIDLSQAAMTDIDAVMDRLATAPGVVFDLHGYPNSNYKVLSHLLTRPDDSTWMSSLAVATRFRPDSTPPP